MRLIPRDQLEDVNRRYDVFDLTIVLITLAFALTMGFLILAWFFAYPVYRTAKLRGDRWAWLAFAFPLLPVMLMPMAHVVGISRWFVLIPTTVWLVGFHFHSTPNDAWLGFVLSAAARLIICCPYGEACTGRSSAGFWGIVPLVGIPVVVWHCHWKVSFDERARLKAVADAKPTSDEETEAAVA